MTSNNIYTSEKALPYVYRLDNPITGEFYIGYRKANKLPSHLDFPTYRTSAPKVTATFSLFEWKIMAEFFDGDDAYYQEQLSIFEEWGNPLLLNERCYHGKGKFRNNSPHSQETKNKIAISNTGKKHTEETKEKHRGKVVVKDSDGVCSKVLITDPRYISSELNHCSVGLSTVKDFEGNIFKITKDDPRIVSDELVGVTKGMTTVRNSLGDCFQVPNNDPRLLSGELVGPNKGNTNPGNNKGKVAAKFVATDISIQVDKDDPRLQTGELVGVTKGRKLVWKKKREQITCPHCNKTGDSSNMKKHHFDKCKTIKNLS